MNDLLAHEIMLGNVDEALDLVREISETPMGLLNSTQFSQITKLLSRTTNFLANLQEKYPINKVSTLVKINIKKMEENRNLLTYQYRAEFPVHFTASILEHFRSDKGKQIRNSALDCTVGVSGNTILCLRENMSKISYFLV